MPRIPTFTEVKRQSEKAAVKVPLPPRGYVPSFNDANRVIIATDLTSPNNVPIQSFNDLNRVNRETSPQPANVPINPNDAVRGARNQEFNTTTNSNTVNSTIRGNQALQVDKTNSATLNATLRSGSIQVAPRVNVVNPNDIARIAQNQPVINTANSVGFSDRVTN